MYKYITWYRAAICTCNALVIYAHLESNNWFCDENSTKLKFPSGHQCTRSNPPMLVKKSIIIF